LKWFDERPETFSRPLDIVQIALVCALGYADFRFPDSGWRDAFPNIVAFNDRMMQRESVKATMPPSA
jgi:glutathione S-transferase